MQKNTSDILILIYKFYFVIRNLMMEKQKLRHLNPSYFKINIICLSIYSQSKASVHYVHQKKIWWA